MGATLYQSVTILVMSTRVRVRIGECDISVESSVSICI